MAPISNDGLEFEQFGYNQLFKLVQYNVTPNILCKVAASMIPDFTRDFLNSPTLSTIKPDIVSQISTINTSKGYAAEASWINTGVIITQPGDITLQKELKNLTNEERCQVMFQLVYTLYVFEKIQFSHGDLHVGNIFILNLPEERELCYLVEGQVFRFRTKKLVKIYDFDHSMIAKDTRIRVNRTEHFEIVKRLNPIRDTDSDFNVKYAETNIFNKNLDLLICYNYFSYVYPNMFTKLEMDPTDPEFNEFFQDCLPGFNSANPLSNETIRARYSILLQNPKNRAEANRIFGIKIDRADEMERYYISDDVYNMTWMDYFKELKEEGHFGRIVKDFDDYVDNNHLWIPDEIVVPKIDMLTNRYFNRLRSDIPIDIRRESVYTIDGRV
jgi:hypothetical protein